jgi:excisionase family DNA binding protein
MAEPTGIDLRPTVKPSRGPNRYFPEPSVRPDTCLTLTVEEAAEALGISRAFAYEAVARGEIPSVRIGRRIIIPRVALERMLNE